MSSTLPLRRRPDFRRLWFSQVVSNFGSWMGAISLLAILVLEATPAEMGILATLEMVPALLFGLIAGAWIDRVRRRSVLIATDLGRAALLVVVVALALTGRLTMTLLFPLVFAAGTLRFLFGVGQHAYLPVLVPRDQLVEANGVLEASNAVVESVAPGAGGVLVQLIGAPLTIAVDALTFVLSALSLTAIRTTERERGDTRVSGGPASEIWGEIRVGWRFLLDRPVLRALTFTAATRSFFGNFFAALYSLFALRTLGLSPALLGIVIGTGGIGAFLGAASVRRLTLRWGVGKTLLISMVAVGLFAVLIPVASGPVAVAAGLLIAGQILGDLFLAVYNVVELSVRQAASPDDVLGRINATHLFLADGIGALGILTGGLLGNIIGIRPAIVVAVLGILAAPVWLILSPVRQLQTLADA